LAEDEEAWALTVDSETDAVELLRAIECRRQDAEDMAETQATRIAKIKARQERFERREKAMRGLALAIMNAAQIKSQELPEATLSIIKGRERVVVANDADVPAIYCHPPVVKPDLKKIKTALDAGERFNWASIQIGEPSLKITTG
jgi:hypothetical protein